MSIFITLLAFDNYALINSSKIAILAGSFLAGILGLVILALFLPKEAPETGDDNSEMVPD
jgi:NhaA family Na+:H+ antiporter